MRRISIALSALLLTFLVGCQSQPVQQQSQPQSLFPNWIDNPGNGVVGSSVTHVKGRHHQEQLAISRARQQLAARQGVEVEYVQMSTETVTNETASSKVKRVGTEEVVGKTVKAKVAQKWLHPVTREVFVLVVPVN
jgi:cell division protein FtsL